MFDIQQGVAICLMIRSLNRESKSTIVRHANLWGDRASKYSWLETNDFTSTPWTELTPTAPYLFFYPRDTEHGGEYENYPRIQDIFGVMGLGFQSSRDHLVVDFSDAELTRKIDSFMDPDLSDAGARDKFFPGKKVKEYAAGDTRQWSLVGARQLLRNEPGWRTLIRQTLYRPFDIRSVLYDDRMVDWPRPDVLGNMLTPNLCLLVNRQSKEPCAALCSDMITERKIAAVYDASTTNPAVHPRSERRTA